MTGRKNRQGKLFSTVRGYRNKNPGNIDFNESNAWRGQVGIEDHSLLKTTPRFAKFETHEDGIRATAKLIRNHMLGTTSTAKSRYDGPANTVEKIIGIWAPPNENKTDKYVEFVAKQLNVDKDKELDANDPNVIKQLVKAVIDQENLGQPYDDSVINRGVNQAFTKKERSIQSVKDVSSFIDNPVLEDQILPNESQEEINRLLALLDSSKKSPDFSAYEADRIEKSTIDHGDGPQTEEFQEHISRLEPESGPALEERDTLYRPQQTDSNFLAETLEGIGLDDGGIPYLLQRPEGAESEIDRLNRLLRNTQSPKDNYVISPESSPLGEDESVVEAPLDLKSKSELDVETSLPIDDLTGSETFDQLPLSEPVEIGRLKQSSKLDPLLQKTEENIFRSDSDIPSDELGELTSSDIQDIDLSPTEKAVNKVMEQDIKDVKKLTGVTPETKITYDTILKEIQNANTEFKDKRNKARFVSLLVNALQAITKYSTDIYAANLQARSGLDINYKPVEFTPLKMDDTLREDHKERINSLIAQAKIIKDREKGISDSLETSSKDSTKGQQSEYMTSDGHPVYWDNKRNIYVDALTKKPVGPDQRLIRNVVRTIKDPKTDRVKRVYADGREEDLTGQFTPITSINQTKDPVQDKVLKETRKDFKKAANDIGTRFTSARQILSELRANEKLTENVVKTKMPRMFGEVGNLSEFEQKVWTGSPEIKIAVKRMFNKYFDEQKTLTSEDVDILKRLINRSMLELDNELQRQYNNEIDFLDKGYRIGSDVSKIYLGTLPSYNTNRKTRKTLLDENKRKRLEELRKKYNR